MPKKIISLDELSRFKDNLDLVLDNKANVDGNYPTMHVGLADDLYYKGGQGSLQTKPFIFQATGTDSNTSTVQIGNFASFRSLRGNSVVLNQLVQNGNFADSSVWFAEGGVSLSISGGVATITNTISNNGIAQYVNFISGHKYIVIAELKTDDSLTIRVGSGSGSSVQLTATPTSNFNKYAGIFTCSSNSTLFYIFSNGTGTYQVKNVMLVDLTLMFGATNEPTSTLEFNMSFPKLYYEYNEGTLLSCKVNGIKVVGYNAFDGEWQDGSLDETTGEEIANVNRSRSGFIKVVAGQTYSLGQETPSSITSSVKYLYEYDGNKNFIRFVSVYLNNPNWVDTPLVLSNNTQYVRLLYPRARINDNIYFHLTWDGSRTGYEEYHSETYPLPNVELRSNPNTGTYDEIIPDGTYIQRVDIRAYQSGDESDNSVFTDKTNTIYDLQTPIETQNDNYKYQQIQPIDDFGTQEFLYDSDIDIPIPQGYEAYYPANYTALVDQLYRHTDGDAYKLVLETELNAKVLNFMTAISGYDSTKTQTLKNVSGTLTWVDDE